MKKKTKDAAGKSQTEHELAFLRKVFEVSGEVVFFTDPNEVFLWVNPQFTKLYGYPPEEIVGKATPAILTTPSTSRAQDDRFWEQIRAERTTKAEFVNRARDGTLVFTEGTYTTVCADDGHIVGYLAIQRSIGERRSMESRLRESEERYRTLVESSPDGILMLSVLGEILLCNRTALELTGRESDDRLIGTQLLDLLAPVEHERARRNIYKAAGGEQVLTAEAILIGRDAARYSVELTLTPVSGTDRSVKAILAILHDISDRKHLESQLAHAQKMEAIGRLAGGIAHDFNNLMTAVIGYADLIVQDKRVSDAVRADVAAIKKAGEKATSLTRQLLIFSRKQVLQPRIVDLNVVVSDTEKILRRVIGEDIRLSIQLEPALGRTMTDPAQMEQVLINLAINSREVMPQGGGITIETRNVVVDRVTAGGRLPIEHGSYVMLSFSDTGPGMDPETQARIFEPFFTSKDGDKRAGLGLATAYGIIRQSGGHIFTQSEPGRGTTFRIYMPRAEEKHAPATKIPEEKARGGDETVLLVEDEEGVRSLMAKYLRSRGYNIVEARDGVEALRALVDTGQRPDVLVTDVILPHMGGLELSRSLPGKDGALRVIFLSGYSEQAVIQDTVLGKNAVFLQKPFTPETLARNIRELLDRPL